MELKKILIVSVACLMAFSFVPVLANVAHANVPAFEKESSRYGNTSSLNWAGYAAVGSIGSVHNVSISFIIPSTDTSGGSYAAFWVGIDGYNDGTVEQTGILAEPSGNGAHAHTVYEVWYEFYPAAPVYASFTASAGDYVYANVTHNVNGTFTTYIKVSTSNGSSVGTLTATATVSSAEDDSAEWIAEAPASGGRILPLADFGTVDYGSYYTKIGFTNYATINDSYEPMGSFNPVEIIMVSSNGTPQATPSAIFSDGTSFSITYDQTQVTKHPGPHFGKH